MDRVATATSQLLRLWATAIVAAVYMVISLGLSAAMTGLTLACAGGLALFLTCTPQAVRGVVVCDQRQSDAGPALRQVQWHL
jgi:hypothetical protein